MKSIKDIDTNFKADIIFDENDCVWFPATEEYFSLHGVFLTENGYRRMDASAEINDNITLLNTNTTGGRIIFETDSPYVSIRVKAENQTFSHMCAVGSAGFDLYIDEGEGFRFLRSFFPDPDFKDGYDAQLSLENDCFNKKYYVHKRRKMMIHFPLYNEVKALHIGLKKDCFFKKFNPYKNTAPVVYYGSSITQGASASHPGNCYPAIVAQKINVDFINLGFSGSARGEVEMAEYISNLPMSVFVFDYDHNDVFFPELLRERHYRFYEIVRKKNKDIPIIFMSAPFTPRAEATLAKTRKIVIESYEKAKANGDDVYFIDGKTIYGEEHYDCGTVDGAHPTDYGFVKMAEAVLKVMKEIGI